jgi:hypothetical protein
MAGDQQDQDECARGISRHCHRSADGPRPQHVGRSRTRALFIQALARPFLSAAKLQPKWRRLPSLVSRVSKPAGRKNACTLPTWKSATQQVWKPALRQAGALPENLRRKAQFCEIVVYPARNAGRGEADIWPAYGAPTRPLRYVQATPSHRGERGRLALRRWQR